MRKIALTLLAPAATLRLIPAEAVSAGHKH